MRGIERGGFIVGLVLVGLVAGASAQPLGHARMYPQGVYDDALASGSNHTPPAQAIDGNVATRWSRAEDGATITFLVPLATYDQLGVNFYNGHQRQFTFDIETSEDGLVFLPAATGVVSVLNNGLQVFTFPEVPATHIRIIGHGNNSSNVSAQKWTSIEEVEFYALVD